MTIEAVRKIIDDYNEQERRQYLALKAKFEP